jgi:hypothetical protein
MEPNAVRSGLKLSDGFYGLRNRRDEAIGYASSHTKSSGRVMKATRPHLSPLPQERVNPKGIASSSPGLRGTSYPGCGTTEGINPNGVVSGTPQPRRNPVGVDTHSLPDSQGSSCLATLGYGPESRWDSTSPHLGIVFKAKPAGDGGRPSSNPSPVFPRPPCAPRTTRHVP